MGYVILCLFIFSGVLLVLDERVSRKQHVRFVEEFNIMQKCYGIGPPLPIPVFKAF